MPYTINPSDYKPNNDLPPLPPHADIETREIMRRAISANRALAELKSKAELLPDQDILISSIAMAEAKDSSAIENIVTTSDLLYKADISPENTLDPNTKEVRGYNRALWAGMKLIEKHPLSTNTFIKIAQIIKQKEIGIRKAPGTVLENPATGRVIYTPPSGENVIRDKLKNLEDFLYRDEFAHIDPLIKMALMHYQFEAIHPFHDGNGRTGRLINILYLVQMGLLNKPVLFLSRYFLNNRMGYYKGLNDVTTDGKWSEWILYMLDAVEHTSKSTCKLIDKIILMREHCRAELQTYFPKIYSADLVDTVFSSPYFRLEFYMRKNPTISRQTASKHLAALCKPYVRDNNTCAQILTMSRVGRDNVYFNRVMFAVLNGQ